MKKTTKTLLTLVAIVTASSASSSHAQGWFDFFRSSKKAKAVERNVEPRRVSNYDTPLRYNTPAPVRKVSEPVYIDQLAPRVTRIDKLGHEMLTTYGKEVAEFPECDYSMALYGEMKIYCVKARKLVKAHKGTSKKDFNIAVCDVRDSLLKIQKLHKKAIVSNHVCNLIDRSVIPVTFVVDNRNDFLTNTYAAR